MRRSPGRRIGIDATAAAGPVAVVALVVLVVPRICLLVRLRS